MEADLEYKIKDFRERMIGEALSNKYPIEFSKGRLVKSKHAEQEQMSNSDSIKFFLRIFGKLMIPYTGDKSMIEWVRLETKINPERKNRFLFCDYGFIIGKYGALVGSTYLLLDKIF